MNFFRITGYKLPVLSNLLVHLTCCAVTDRYYCCHLGRDHATTVTGTVGRPPGGLVVTLEAYTIIL